MIQALKIFESQLQLTLKKCRDEGHQLPSEQENPLTTFYYPKPNY